MPNGYGLGVPGLEGARMRRQAQRGRTPGARIRTATDGRDILLNSPDGWEVSEPWLWWDGPAGGDSTGGPWGNPPPGAWPPEGWALPAVTRCTSLIADTLAAMPWHVVRERERLPTPDWIDDPQARRVDQRIVGGTVPQWRRSKVEFWSAVVTSILWWGEGIVYVPNRGADGTPLPPVWQLHPAHVDVWDETYGIPNPDDPDGPAAYEFGPEELIVVRAHTRPDSVRGVGVLQNHAYDLGLARAVRDFGRGMFQRGIPSGYLKVTAPQLTQQQATDLQKRWMAQHGGPRPKVAILNATTEFQELRMDPWAAQLAEMRRMSILDIALLFGVPPYVLGLPSDSATYANVESRLIELRDYTFLPWVSRIESALGAEFPRGTDLRINMDATLRADTLSRYQAHAIALNAGFLTLDEVRDLEDRPPIPAAEAPAQLTVVGAAEGTGLLPGPTGNVPVAPAPNLPRPARIRRPPRGG